ncbi:hypothetical protein SAMN02746095_00015 [Acidocella aminolytica 101 = DSM 11237]|uniref:Uncharacterized protein n=1 Tax=Acidocella aminolytica 101 = DSM 11237 TaxID=1120923 RepID=A0A0D6PI99_9PROT|nr:hypothetical protein Aam_051_018 [Acidocella aminolytica 101 = DSM 11237]GBQ43044.1 hypothetical protein AA11237_3158 [Acidocella aminolytica 101 = DSM 11237]SHE29003.1 hypothetical protein SAMN02746095_00015 [Acidocella aminolytica 101 = DSM 11237]
MGMVSAPYSSPELDKEVECIRSRRIKLQSQRLPDYNAPLMMTVAAVIGLLLGAGLVEIFS